MKTTGLFLSPLRRAKSRRDSTSLTVCFSLRAILLLAVAFFFCASLHAQVTIGGLTKPAKGAILDLNSTTKGGLVLSNVELTNPEQIPGGVFVGIPNLQEENFELTGTIVYNTKESPGISAGIYVWDGERWNRAGCTLPALTLTPPAGTYTFYTGVPSQDFAVSAIGDAAGLSYQWQSSANGVNGWYNIAANGNLATYPAPMDLAGDYYYRCLAGKSCGATASEVYTVSIRDPEMNISPATKVIDFGYTSTAQTVSITTNAPWKFTKGADYDDVVTTAENTRQDAAHTPGLPDLDRSVSFTPKYSPSTETLTYGTELTGKAIFTTAVELPGVAEVTDEVTFKRKVQLRHGVPTFNPAANSTLPRADATVDVTVSSNADWYAEVQGNSSTRQTETASTYGSKTLTVSVPDNNTWNTRNVVIATAYDGGTPTTATYSQTGISLAYSSGLSTSYIPKVGRTENLTFTGDAPAFTLRAVDASTEAVIASVSVSAFSGTTSKAITVPSTTSSRDVRFEFYRNTAWVTIGTLRQISVAQDAYKLQTVFWSWSGVYANFSYSTPSGYAYYDVRNSGAPDELTEWWNYCRNVTTVSCLNPYSRQAVYEGTGNLGWFNEYRTYYQVMYGGTWTSSRVALASYSEARSELVTTSYGTYSDVCILFKKQ
jgi:hypothetical protein